MNKAMELKRMINSRGGKIQAMEQGEEMGFVSFVLHQKVMHLEHTVVDPAYRGKHIGKLLIEDAVKVCRENGWKMHPVCSYADVLLQRNIDWHDVSSNSLSTAQIVDELLHMGSPAKAAHLMRFFKTAPGEYGHGDVFVGITVPQIRAYEKAHRPWTLAQAEDLLNQDYHEIRLLGLLVMVRLFNIAKSDTVRKAIVDCYLRNTPRINNWDLVDLSAPNIIGAYLYGQPDTDRSLLDRLAASEELWEQRIAMVSTFQLLYHGEHLDTVRIARTLLYHQHDLIRKAVGWMLREMGKRVDECLLLDFLDEYADSMPRTALRYAIERLSPELKLKYMNARCRG